MVAFSIFVVHFGRDVVDRENDFRGGVVQALHRQPLQLPQTSTQTSPSRAPTLMQAAAGRCRPCKRRAHAAEAALCFGSLHCILI